jgi:hypothetical protein
MSQSRRFTFTLPNYTQEELDALRVGPLGRDNSITYILYGLETCPTTGTPHVQGYLEVKKKLTISAVRRFNLRAHYEVCQKPCVEYQKGYCWKLTGHPSHNQPEPNAITFEEGSAMRQGQRNDLNAIGEQIVAGVLPQAIAEENPGMYARYHRGLHALRAAVIDPPRDQATPKNVIVYFGPTGTGKTRSAVEQLTAQYGDYYLWDPTLHPWWDGYDCHRGVVIDEFRGQLPFSVILRLLDRYRMTVQIKGGMRQFVADTIYITSPKHPDEWYKDDGSDKIAQLKRRITTIEFKDTPVA